MSWYSIAAWDGREMRWCCRGLVLHIQLHTGHRDSANADGTVRLDYWDDRPEPIDVLLKARRRIKSPQPSQQ